MPRAWQSTATPETRAERGLAVQRDIAGAETVERLHASATADRAHIQRLLSVNCFGDHFTRASVDVRTRELLTFAMLVALGGCDAQVSGQVAASLNVGNDRRRLIDVATQLLPYIGYPRTLNALPRSTRSRRPTAHSDPGGQTWRSARGSSPVSPAASAAR